MQGSRLIEMMRKEFIQLLRNKKVRPLLIGLPLIQLLLFGYVVNFDVNRVDVIFLDQSKSVKSRDLINAITAGGIFRYQADAASSKEIDEALLGRSAQVGIVIPHDFASKVKDLNGTRVQLIINGSISHLASTRIGHLSQTIEKYNQQLMKDRIGAKMEFGRINTQHRAWYNPNIESQIFFVPCVVAFIVMIMSMLLTSMAIVHEKEIGTMEQIIVTPVKRWEFIVAKVIPYLLICLLMIVVVGIAALYIFDLSVLGNPIWIFLGALLFLVCTTSIGLLISTIVSTQQAAMMTTFLLLVPFVLLSGFVFPIENMPPFVQMITYIDPLRFFLVIIRAVVLKGVGWDVIQDQFLALAVLGFTMMLIAILRWRKTID